MKAVASALVVLACAGCHSHVQLRVPPRTAPLRERVAAARKLLPKVMSSTYQGGVKTSVDFLQLNDGRRVYYPQDLLPVVAPDSPTASAAKTAASNRKWATRATYSGVPLFVTGLGYTMHTLVTNSQNNEEFSKPKLMLGGTLIVASVVAGVVYAIMSTRAADETTTAYTTYEDALLDNLRICIEKKEIYDCDGREDEPAPSITRWRPVPSPPSFQLLRPRPAPATTRYGLGRASLRIHPKPLPAITSGASPERLELHRVLTPGSW